jgi:hypothetical protein
MAEEFWGIVVVALFSIGSNVVVWYLNYKSTKKMLIIQSVAGYIQEVMRDNYRLLNHLRQIEMKQDIRENLAKCQELFDSRPYNFDLMLIRKWPDAKRVFQEHGNFNAFTEIMALVTQDVDNFDERYRVEVLGEKRFLKFTEEIVKTKKR